MSTVTKELLESPYDSFLLRGIWRLWLTGCVDKPGSLLAAALYIAGLVAGQALLGVAAMLVILWLRQDAVLEQTAEILDGVRGDAARRNYLVSRLSMAHSLWPFPFSKKRG